MVQNNKTVAELKNELYVATLIEMHKNNNDWLTKTIKNEYKKKCIEPFETAKEMYITQEEALSLTEEFMMPLYKEKDILLYLLLTFSMSHLEISKLTDEEMNFAQGLIISEFKHNMEETSLAISEIINRLKKWYKTPAINHDFVAKSLELDCKNGLNCFEPFSHFFDYSDTLAYSMDELVIYKCLQSCTISFLSNEQLHELFYMGWCSTDYPGLSEEQIEEVVEGKIQSAISNFVNRPKIKLVPNSKTSAKEYLKSDRKYECILLPLDFLIANIESMNIDFFMEHVCDGGRVVLYGWPDEEDNSCSNTEYRMQIEKIAHRFDFATYFPKQKLGRGMELYVFIKGKTSSKVDVYYPYETNSFSEMDVIHEGMFNQVELTSDDLIALNYDMSKLEWIPRTHVAADERYLTLKDFLEASKDEHIQLKHSDFGKVFSPDNYATSFDTFVVHPSSLREAQVDDKWKKVSQPVFVMRSNPFAVAYVEASKEHPVFFREHTTTFSVKNDVVDLKYLYLLSTNGKLEQLVKDCPSVLFDDGEYTLYTDEKGKNYVGYWPAKSLLCDEGLIAIPSLSKQKDLCDSFVKLERSRLDRAAMSQYRQDIHERKHALGQIMTQMRSNWESLLLAKNEHDGILDDEFVYGKKHPHTIKQIFETLDSYMKELDEGIESFTPEDNAIFQTKEKIFLQDYLQEYVKTHSNPCFELQIDSSDESRELGAIVFSKKALETILQNLIFNAWKHGFKGRNSGNIIRFSISEDDNSIQLLVSNNGTPLDKNMDNGELFKFGKSSSRGQESIDGHHHIGLGCHQVWCLMRDKGQGDVQCISEPDKEYPVSFKLVFNK